MKKKAKTAKKQASIADEMVEHDPSDGSQNIDAQISVLGGLIQQAQDHMASMTTYDMEHATHIALMATKQGVLISEQRKIRMAERGRITKITPAIIISWVRLQPREYREQLARDVIAMDAEGVLA